MSSAAPTSSVAAKRLSSTAIESPFSIRRYGLSPAKRFKPDYSKDLITVLVGSAETEFVIHTSTLCKSSMFFEAACRQEWKEGQEKVIRLPEAESEAFGVYIHWLYAGLMETTLMDEPPSPYRPPSCRNLSKLWILGNFLGDHDFTNRAIDRLLLKLDSYPSKIIREDTMQYIWERTPRACNIRRLLLDVMTARLNAEKFETDKDTYSRELLVDLVGEYVTRHAKTASPTFSDRCDYHTHGDGEPKCGMTTRTF